MSERSLLVSLEAVAYRYGSGADVIPVLDGVDLSVREGEFVVVAGPSGSGKSTLLNLLGGLERPQGGRIVVAGTPVSESREEDLAEFRNRTIGFVFQAFHLLPVLTAAENVAWPLYFRGVPRRERMARAREMLAAVGLEREVDRFPGKLSGGQRQRVAIARALVGRPRLVIADEPTANLDRRTAGELMALLGRLRHEEGVGVICATHDPLVAEQADRLLELRDGLLHEVVRQAPVTGDGNAAASLLMAGAGDA
jgi:putative ABC transport system ATP-binding protein